MLVWLFLVPWPGPSLQCNAKGTALPQEENHRFSEWGSFTPCSATCGEGKKYRSRFCTDGRHGGTKCPTSLEQQTEKCKVKDCAIPPDTIVFSSTAGAAEWVGSNLGEFVRMGDYYNNRPYYKQRDTEGEDRYLYYVSDGYMDGWMVGDTLGGSYSLLCNRQDNDLPPRTNWLYENVDKWLDNSNKWISGSKRWSDDDRTLKLEYTTLSPCKVVRVAGSGRVLNRETESLGFFGYFRLQEGRWSEGRPVYKKGSGSTAQFLRVNNKNAYWVIGDSTTGYGNWIKSGRATNSPTSSRAGGSGRFGVTRWRYAAARLRSGDWVDWKEGDISVTCN